MTLREEVVQHGFAADYIRYLIKFMEDKGVEKSLILKAAGIEESDLEKGNKWINHTVDYNSFSKSLQGMSKNSLIGLEFGASISLKEHGYIGYAAGNAATLGEAIDMLAKYFRTRTTMFSLIVVEEGDFNIIQVESHTDLGEGLKFWIQAILGTLMRVSTEIFGEELVGKLMNESEARFSFDKPDIVTGEVADLLQSVTFGHTINQIRIPTSLMDLPLKNPD